MPVTLRALRCLLLAVLCAHPAGVAAQELPRRDNLEEALVGGTAYDVSRRRHVVELQQGAPAILPADGSGRLVDVHVLDGPAPDLWASEGGALFADRPGTRIAEDLWLHDTRTTGRRWVMLEPSAPARVVAHLRNDGERRVEDPWQVPLAPQEREVRRERPERHDHLAPLDSNGVRFDVRGRRAVRLDLWRAQVPRLLPPDATWLRVVADGRVLFDGRAPTPFTREHAYTVADCGVVLDVAGRLHLDLPEDMREILVFGEPGTWLNALAPLPGTPPEVLAASAAHSLERIAQQPGEPLAATFDRAVAAWPAPEAERFFARYAYYRDVAILPLGDAPLRSRAWRARHPDREMRFQAETNLPMPGEHAVGSTTFHWLAPGGRWRLDLPPEQRLGLLRISVAHPTPDMPPAQLSLEQAGRSDRRFRLAPPVVAALMDASAAVDPLLAVDPAGDPIVDASQAVVPVVDLATPLVLANTGGSGAWIALEQRIPAPRRLAMEALSVFAGMPERLRLALLAGPAGPGMLGRLDDLAVTRALDRARQLLQARAGDFASDPCVADAPVGAAGAARALALATRIEGDDPFLARCAVLRAASLAPSDADAWAALDAWAARNERADLRTGFIAWALADPARRDDPLWWRRLADALESEREFEVAALAAFASGEITPGRLPERADAGGVSLPPVQSDGAIRLATDRDTEIPYALARGHAASWIFPTPGTYTVELRSHAPEPAVQWVRLRSGGRSWVTALRPASPQRTDLRELASGGAPGLALRLPIQVPSAGTRLDVESIDAPMIGRVIATDALARRDVLTDGLLRPLRVETLAAAACDIREVESTLAVLMPASPVPLPAGSLPVDPLPTAALLADPDGVLPPPPVADAQPAELALLALWQLGRGPAEAGLATAARAFAMRESHPGSRDAATAFALLEDRVTWRRLDPVASAGRRLRQQAGGHSSNPLIARRQAIAGADDDTRFILRPDQGWVLEGLQPGQRVQLVLRQRAALPAAPVEVELTSGERRTLGDGEVWRPFDTADADGELHLRLGDALPGTFVTVDVANEAGEPFDTQLGIAYHRAPVRVELDRPSWLRVVEWDGQRSVVTMRWIDRAGDAVLRPERLPGASLRVSRMVLREPASPSGDADATPVSRPALPPRLAPGLGAASDTPAPPPAPAAPLPVPTEPALWPRAWPASGGEDHTWGFAAGLRQRIAADDDLDARERIAEASWFYRYRVEPLLLWGRADVTARRHDEGFNVFGASHVLEWQQVAGPWGATLANELWFQQAPPGLRGDAYSLSTRAAVDWTRVYHERWRQKWELGLRLLDLSQSDVPGRFGRLLDNDVYTRYRDEHPNQLDLDYQLTWRARYDTEWVFRAGASSNPVQDFGLDNADASLEWRWARHGWTASAEVEARRYFPDGTRRRAFDRTRIEASIGRMFLDHDDGWRLRARVGFDTAARQAYGGLEFTWFDHDGRSLTDFRPSEFYLRDVLETDLVNPLLPPDAYP